jgi:hypothetical protein
MGRVCMGRFCVGKGSASGRSDFARRPGCRNNSKVSNWSDLSEGLIIPLSGETWSALVRGSRLGSTKMLCIFAFKFMSKIHDSNESHPNIPVTSMRLSVKD